MKCFNCDANLSADAKFCSYCGSKIEEIPLPAMEDETVVFPQNMDDKEIQKDQNVDPTHMEAEATKKEKNTIADKLKEKVKALWGNMGLFYKMLSIATFVVAILTIVAFCVGRALPIIVSILQIGAIVVAVLVDREIIKWKKGWIKYLILCAAIILAVGNIASYSVGRNATQKPSVAQPKEKIVTPCSSEECIGKQKDEVVSDFELAGFVDVTVEALDDLSIEDMTQSGAVASVTIDGDSSFTGDQEYMNTAEIIISYHSIVKVFAPIDALLAETTPTEELIEIFTDAGFVNIETTEVFDLDPDEEILEYKNVVTFDGESEFDTMSMFPLDSNVQIITHRAYEKYDLKIVVDFVSNLLFNTYDVIMSVNDETLTLNHGEDGTFEYRLKEGTYQIEFAKDESSSVKESVEIELTGDTEASYKITCHSDKIAVETLYVENSGAVGEGEAMVPASATDCKYEDYADVTNWLEDAGFTNITTEILYDIVWGWTDEGEVESVTIDGKTDFIRGDVFAKDVLIVITYHMNEEDDPNKPVESEPPETASPENTPTTMAGAPDDWTNLLEKHYEEVKKQFEDAGFTNITCVGHEIDYNENTVFEGSVVNIAIGENGEICTFEKGEQWESDVKIRIDYRVKPAMPASEYEKAFIRDLSEYDLYYMFDTDSQIVVTFSTNDTYVDVGAYWGDFDSGVTIAWAHGEWIEVFTHKGGNYATLTDGNGFEWDYEVCDVASAQRILDGLQ